MQIHFLKYYWFFFFFFFFFLVYFFNYSLFYIVFLGVGNLGGRGPWTRGPCFVLSQPNQQVNGTCEAQFLSISALFNKKVWYRFPLFLLPLSDFWPCLARADVVFMNVESKSIYQQ